MVEKVEKKFPTRMKPNVRNVERSAQSCVMPRAKVEVRAGNKKACAVISQEDGGNRCLLHARRAHMKHLKKKKTININ